MSTPIWPNQIQGIAWTRLRSMDGGRNIVQESAGGDTVRIPQTYNPIWTWTLMYEFLFDNWAGPVVQAYAPYTDLRYFMGFIMAAQGQANDILFDDPYDDSVGPGVTGSPPVANTQAQLQLVNDGGSPPVYYSPIQRNMGGLFYEDVTDLNGSLTLYANGVKQTSGYTILGPGLAIPGYSWRGLVVQWASQPAAPITATFKFYFRVRLAADTTDFEQWADQLWTIGGENSRNGTGTLKLISSRPPAA